MFIFLLLAIACSGLGQGDSDVSGMPYCDETSQSIERDDDAGIGIPASDLLDALPYAEDLALTWGDEAEDSLTWSFEADESTLALVLSEAVYPEASGPVPAIAVECHDYLSVAGVLTLYSSDGRLDEARDVTLEVYGGGSVSEGPLAVVSEIMEVTDLQGPLEVEDYLEPSDYDALSLILAGEIYFAEEMLSFSGRLQGRAETTNGDFAMMELIDIASWTAADVE
jgi:hypothetical protein